MGILEFGKSPAGMEKKLEGLEIEGEVLTAEAENAEKKAIIAQLKKQYGHDWKNVLGLKDLTLGSLRSVLKSGKGLKQMAGGFTGGLSTGPNLGHLRKGTPLNHLRRL